MYNRDTSFTCDGFNIIISLEMKLDDFMLRDSLEKLIYFTIIVWY